MSSANSSNGSPGEPGSAGRPRKSSADTRASTGEETDASDEDEFEISKVDRDVREILNVEQTHISHVGMMDHLRQFYLAHNPRILQSPNFLSDLVGIFEGRENLLFEKLEETYQTNDPMAFVYASGGSNGRAPVNFLKSISMEGFLFRKPTLKGMRGRVQEIMEPRERWFELCGSLLVWSKGPKHKPRGRMRLSARTVAEPIGERNFRIKTAGKVLLMLQAKTKEIRDTWVQTLQTALEHLAMEAKRAQLDAGARETETSASVDINDASRLTDVETDDDDDAGGAAPARASDRGSRRRSGHVDEYSSEEECSAATQPASTIVPAANGVVKVTVAPSLVSGPDAEETINNFKRATRSSLQIARRKILSAAGIVAVTALVMQYYGLVPVLVSAVVGVLCIYARFFDVTDAPPHAAGTIVLSAVADSQATVSGNISPGTPTIPAVTPSDPTPGRHRRKSRVVRKSRKGRTRHGKKSTARVSSDEDEFADCVNDSMTQAAGDGGGGAKPTEVVAETKKAVSNPIPPLHVYGELGIRFLPEEPGIVPRGLSFKINDDFHPVPFETPFFKGRMVMRIKDAIGAPRTPYFNSKRRLFSIQIEGRFKQRLRTDRVLFGSSFKHKISMPRGASIAMSILKSIDSALQEDLFAEKNPWIMSPLICAVERLQVRKPDPNDTENDGLGPWRYGGDRSIEEDSSLVLSEEKKAKMGDKKMSFGARRKYFGDVKKREATYWEPDLVYTFDFLSARMDFNTYKVKMAKFIEFGTTKLMNNQPFRLEARVMDENDNSKKIGAMWAFEFCHNKVSPFPAGLQIVDHSNDM